MKSSLDANKGRDVSIENCCIEAKEKKFCVLFFKD